MIDIDFKWDWKQAIDKATGTLHPSNKKYIGKITRSFNFENQIEVIHPKNKRKLKIDGSQIYLIEAMDELSKLYTVNNQIYYIKGRLKDLESL
ncbi:LytTR family transcriptional regulator, partial [Pediococcus acidilactici]